MKPIDFAKALGLAVAVLALNLLLTTLAIFVYSMTIDTGHDQAYYTAMAPKIGAWTGPVGGMLLMFGTGWLFGRRRPARNPFAFIGVVWGVYVVIDVAMGLGMAPAAELFKLTFILSLTGAALAGFAGAALSRRR